MFKINNKDCQVIEETIKFTKSKINNKDGYSFLLSVDFYGGYLTFYIDKKNQYNDGAVINNDACGILLNLKLMFSGLAKPTNSDGMFIAAEGVE